MLIYLEMLYYQSDERGILDVLEIKIFFAAQPLLNIFFFKKYFCEFFTFVVMSQKVT